MSALEYRGGGEMGDEDDSKKLVRLEEQFKSMKEEIAEMKTDAKTAASHIRLMGLGVISAVLVSGLKTLGVIQ